MASAVSAQESVHIGQVGPISGSIVQLGKGNENGARMAIEELNAKGVTIGGKTFKSTCSQKTTQPIRSKARLSRRSSSTPKCRAWSVT